MAESTGQSDGPATDRKNEPVKDPSPNVLDLVQAAISRQDDLREASEKHQTEVVKLRADCNHEIADLRAQYEDKLRAAETSRIDAIRQVDVGNVQRAAEVQAGVAAALEGKVVATAAAFENRLTATIEPIQKRIDDLTRVQYEGVGEKTSVVETRDVRADTRGASGEMRAVIGLGLAVLAFLGYQATRTQEPMIVQTPPVTVTTPEGGTP